MNFEKRRLYFENLQLRYENKIYLILEPLPESDLPTFSEMIAVRPTNRFYQITENFRKKINLKKEKAIFFFIDNIILTGNITVKSLYDKFKDKDGFLYIKVSNFDSFG